jgi:hypothetical protein
MSMRLREAMSAPVTANTAVPNQSNAVRNVPSIVWFYRHGAFGASERSSLGA